MDPQPQNLSEAQLQERAREAGLLARTPGDWFDIYSEIVEHGVKTVLEGAGQGHEVLEKLAPRRADAKVVRREFMAHGLPLSDAIEIEGPEVTPDMHGFLTHVAWPRGLWVTFFWPDRSKLSFKGSKATVALGFIMWWSDFHVQYLAMKDQSSPKEKKRQAAAPKKRLVEPGSPEWEAYFAAKRKAKRGPGA